MDITELLTSHARGTVKDEADAALIDVVRAVAMTGKPGKVTITVNAAPSGQRVVVTMDVGSKVPVPDPEAGVFYIDRNGVLTRDDPTQGRLPIADIDPTGPTDIEIVDPTGASQVTVDNDGTTNKEQP